MEGSGLNVRVVLQSCIRYVNLALFQNPDYMQEKFIIKIESLHLPDCGTTENVSDNIH